MGWKLVPRVAMLARMVQTGLYILFLTTVRFLIPESKAYGEGGRTACTWKVWPGLRSAGTATCMTEPSGAVTCSIVPGATPS